MLMLHQHITRALFALFLGALFFSSLVSYFAVKNDNIETYQRELISHIRIIKQQLTATTDLEAFAKIIKEGAGIRFTLIDENGVVLADSDKESESMDNHAKREEIIQAHKVEFAQAIRFSDSVKSDFLYVAHRFEHDERTLFIRLAMNIGSIMHNFYALWVKIALIFSLTLLVGLYGAYHLSKKFVMRLIKLLPTFNKLPIKSIKLPSPLTFVWSF
jgi:two-component system, OmpR family, phosphate regulon sensor histidine kinase PhoR